MTGSIVVTGFRKADGPLTKRIHCGADSGLANDSSLCRMTSGSAWRVAIDGPRALADFINAMPATDAYALGSIKPGHPDRVRVVTAANIGRAKGKPHVIARTKEYLTFAAGEPGLTLVDVDFKAMSDGAKRRISEAGGVWDALCGVCPALATAAYVRRASTSSGISNAETGETYRGSGGFHVGVFIMDGADAPRFLADLHGRLWLNGFGWGMVSAAGVFLERSLIDRMVGSPERLIFEGGPIVEPPLVQAPRAAEAHDGDHLETRVACPPLTDAERAEVERLKEAEMLRLQPELEGARKSWSKRHVERLVAAGRTEPEARAAVDGWLDTGVLTGDFALPFDDPGLAGFTVAEVLADPDRFAGKTLADPIEGTAYGKGKAQLFKNGRRLVIHSFAHGGGNYELKAETAGDEIDRAAADEINADHAVVIIGGRTRVLRIAETVHLAGGVRYVYRLPSYLTFDDFRNYYLNRLTIDAHGRPFAVNPKGEPLPLGHWWLGSPLRRTYSGVVFLPGGAPVEDSRLNLWAGFGVEPARGDWSMMREHIRTVLTAGDEAVDGYVLNWLADLVQRPGQQGEVALAFRGKQGTGKGLVGRAVCRLLGQHARHISSPDHLTGKFNAHLQQCCFLFADEATAPQDKKAEGTLKRLITEDTLFIEPKGVDAFEVPNCLHVMLATNHDWVAPAEERERRYVVQDVSERRLGDRPYFTEIYEQTFHGGGLEAMLYDLLERDIAGWHPRDIIRTAALARQQEHSLDPFDQWWLVLLQGGIIDAGGRTPDEGMTNEYDAEEVAGFNGGTRIVKRPGLLDLARRSSPRLKDVSEAYFGRRLAERGCKSLLIRRGAKVARGWTFQPLSVCRDDWVKRFPATDWGGGPAHWGGDD